MVLRDDVSGFIEFVLLDEATRRPSKKQKNPMRGFWLQRSGQIKGIRRSDRRERIYVCIEMLHTVRGWSIERAAIEVAELLGETTRRQIEVVRNAYYEVQKTPNAAITLAYWPNAFYDWRRWVLSTDEWTLQQVLKLYQERFGATRRDRLKALFAQLRRLGL